jgi:hypothetical protein
LGWYAIAAAKRSADQASPAWKTGRFDNSL